MVYFFRILLKFFMKTIFLRLLPFCALSLSITSRASAAPGELSRVGSEGRVSKLRLSTKEVAETVKGRGTKIAPVREGSNPFANPAFGAPAQSPLDLIGVKRAPVYYPEGEAPTEWNRHVLSNQVMLRTAPWGDREALRVQLEMSGIPARCPGYSETLVIAELPDAEAAAASLASLQAMPGVESVEAAFETKSDAFWMPNDPLLVSGNGEGSQWYLDPSDARNLGVSGWWDQYRGNGIRVNVVDDGIQTGHHDLTDNVDRVNDRDYADDDYDPNPLPGDGHGTAVAGIIGGRGNNGRGISGVAPECTLVGVRLDFVSRNPIESADCLHHQSNISHISNNSWGIPTQGIGLAQVGLPGEEAITDGIATGRWGRGLVYLFAAGNSGDVGDDANRSDLLVHPGVVVIGALSPDGKHAAFSNPGANVAVSSWGESVTTTTTGSGYRYDFNGTSAATPVTSGVVALMLDARPTLNYRDVQDILMRTALKPAEVTFRTNRGGYSFNNEYGAGALSGERAVRLARKWSLLNKRITREYPISPILASIADNKVAGEVRTFSVPSSQNIRVESVQLVIHVEHARRGDLQIDIISPSGQVSRVLTASPQDTNKDLAWTMRSVQFWGENSTGTWKARIADTAAGITGRITALKLRLYGSDRTSAPGVSGGYLVETPIGQPLWHETSASGNPGAFWCSGLPAGLAMDDLGLITGVPTASGDFEVTVAASNAAGARSNSFILRVLPPPPLLTGFALWQSSYFSPSSPSGAANADPDSDGAANILEYATGGNPVEANPADGLTTVPSPEGLVLTWSVNPSATGVSLTPECSEDLILWHPLTGEVVTSSTPTRIYKRAVLPIGSEPCGYVRLRAAMAP
jgi:subtilisin family serine protease